MPCFKRKSGQYGSKLASKNEAKSKKHRCKNRSKNRCILGSIFGRILVDFWRKNGGMLAPKSEPKSMLPLKRKNQLNASPLAPNWVRGVQVGSKNRSKIDQKRRSTWEGILASIFDRFWWILGGKLGSKIEQKSIQKAIEKVMKKGRSPRWQKSRSKMAQGGLAPPGRGRREGCRNSLPS